MGSFSEEVFTQACVELETQDTEGWEYFVESHGVTIYRQYHEDTGLYEYKIYGVLEECDPDICAQVYMDLEYRKSWDTYAKDLYEVKEGDKSAIYWQVNFPWPMANRDYVYVREYREMDHGNNHVWLVLAKATEMTSVPEVSGVVRVMEYLSYAALTSDGKGGTQAFMRYYDNPGGSIPTWLINWAASKGVPGFLSTMQTACRGYKDYLDGKQAPSEGNSI